MKILLTNDDGIYAKGLLALYDRFAEKHDVTIIAPDRERSAVGHGLTIYSPIRIKKINDHCKVNGYAVSGTPADCVKLGIVELLDHKPDMVISGINPGANVGININYSGTAAAAREAALLGIPAMAVSVQGFITDHYADAAVFAEKLFEKIVQRGLPRGTFLNVNLPDLPLDKAEGVIISRQGASALDEYFDQRIDTRNRTYYWHGCDLPAEIEIREIDENAVLNNFISVTPVRCDMTDYSLLDDLKTWDIGGIIE
ncbi:5'-nucleotidase [Desulfosarcina sp. BuS5]|uniref:5'/3'-nucleotidase SurE n=1 Tax=Desulfosarcina sp. BuS5 TaxID=933262 RepID=UPI0004876FD4|nr:5'/3'-nucleotidase SurE [Desulfosarcina sp. BuS5]WDN90201.1 5'-nucleotidase [Desulfosarcina sp. BuS5]